MMRYWLLAMLLLPAPAQAFDIAGTEGTRLTALEVAVFDEPWAMTFLPGGSMLVTEKGGDLLLVSADGSTIDPVSGVPKTAYGGQGGLGDIILHPDFASNRLVFLSFAEPGTLGRRGAAVARARLAEDGSRLENLEIIWRQEPKVTGKGHYSHRLVFSSDGHLFITSGDRQKLDPAQDFGSALGKIIRLNADGSVPQDNPWQDKGQLAKTFWSMGHRNLLGIAFDAEGRLWQHEMGPRHGDELNLVQPGANYGWPLVSEGNHYSGANIPNHDTAPHFTPPKAYWVPTIAPSGLVIYDGGLFSAWQGDALIGGLASRALIHVDLEGESASEAERFEWGSRVREVEQGPDGAIYVLEDGSGGRLLKLVPAD
ncbi:PQQ-dependent sugar dehydrogenase [Salaquimonas pukyongi]|uniref:PQQ-dependent sugar dehydrogenase n=1 Tax=Salaquimonas pukyongi TaxID=2712698 RepID=UPI00096BA20E|nr:PQQ-dependent sugar dehydrogenase [Salaquimonas pukyongi]